MLLILFTGSVMSSSLPTCPNGISSTRLHNCSGKIFIDCYSNQFGTKDYFISYESEDKVALFGFIRLRLPEKNVEHKDQDLFPVLKNNALIRELHVYGYNTSVGSDAKASQHCGIGTKLLEEAESIAYSNNYSGIVVISGEGVKQYYTKKGYIEKDTFMYKNIRIHFYNKQLKEIFISLLVIINEIG